MHEPHIVVVDCVLAIRRFALYAAAYIIIRNIRRNPGGDDYYYIVYIYIYIM